MESGPSDEIYGIDDRPITIYYHQVHLAVIGLSSIDIRVGFTDSTGVDPGILGQRGFFDNYMIRFERYKDQLEVFPRSTSI
jgi:hypothetical protein